MMELNEKLARWAGFTWGTYPQEDARGYNYNHYHVKYPDGSYQESDGVIINFTSSLDVCFKWLVPILWICDMTMHEGLFFSWKVGHPSYKDTVVGPAEEDAALALCKAIEQLIDKENDGSKH